jgi:hypothetical protein
MKQFAMLRAQKTLKAYAVRNLPGAARRRTFCHNLSGTEA